MLHCALDWRTEGDPVLGDGADDYTKAITPRRSAGIQLLLRRRHIPANHPPQRHSRGVVVIGRHARRSRTQPRSCRNRVIGPLRCTNLAGWSHCSRLGTKKPGCRFKSRVAPALSRAGGVEGDEPGLVVGWTNRIPVARVASETVTNSKRMGMLLVFLEPFYTLRPYSLPRPGRQPDFRSLERCWRSKCPRRHMPLC